MHSVLILFVGTTSGCYVPFVIEQQHIEFSWSTFGYGRWILFEKPPITGDEISGVVADLVCVVFWYLLHFMLNYFTSWQMVGE